MNQPRIALLEKLNERCQGAAQSTLGADEIARIVAGILQDLIAAMLRNEV